MEGGNTQVVKELHTRSFRILQADPPGRPPIVGVYRSKQAALDDGPLAQALILRRCELRQHAAAPGRLAPDGDLTGITAKGRDVFLDPAHGKLLVQMPEVRRRLGSLLGDLWVAQKTEHIEAVVDGDHHHSPARDAFTVKLHLRRITHLEPAAEEPNEDRQFVLGAGGRRPDVQVQAVLAHGHMGIHVPFKVIDIVLVDPWRGLHGDGPELKSLQITVPVRSRLRCPPPVLADGRGSKGNPLETGNPRISSGQAPH